jgi:tetratricopeptide (TPR) repeat protein
MQFAPYPAMVGHDMFWRHLACFLLAILLVSVGPGSASAQNNDITPALTEASKLLQKGGYAKAIETIDGALRVGKVQTELAAKAFLLRGEANEKLGRAAYAMADYNNALFMKDSLSASDRKRTEEAQKRVTSGLGLAEQTSGGSVATSARAEAAPASQAAAPPPAGAKAPQEKSWNTGVQERPAEEQSTGGGIGGFFNNLFNGSSSAKAPPEETPSTAAAVVTPVEPAPQAKGRPPKKVAAKSEPSAARGPVTAADPVKPPESGNFAIQLAAVANEEDKAIAEADRIAKKFSADLGGRTPSLVILPTADGGTLYKIVAAPFETRGESQATCELLKTKGVNCMVITKK